MKVGFVNLDDDALNKLSFFLVPFELRVRHDRFDFLCFKNGDSTIHSHRDIHTRNHENEANFGIDGIVIETLEKIIASDVRHHQGTII